MSNFVFFKILAFRSVLSVEDLQGIEKTIADSAIALSKSYKIIGKLLKGKKFSPP